MGTWGPGTFDSDAASDFINEETRRHVSACERIFAFGKRRRYCHREFVDKVHAWLRTH